MSQSKKTFLIKYNKLIIVLLGLIGISTSCEPDPDDYVTPLYGVIYAEYQINEDIENDENNLIFKKDSTELTEINSAIQNLD